MGYWQTWLQQERRDRIRVCSALVEDIDESLKELYFKKGISYSEDFQEHDTLIVLVDGIKLRIEVSRKDD